MNPPIYSLVPCSGNVTVLEIEFLFFIIMIFLCVLTDFSYWTKINIIQDYKPVANCLKTHMRPALA